MLSTSRSPHSSRRMQRTVPMATGSPSLSVSDKAMAPPGDHAPTRRPRPHQETTPPPGDHAPCLEQWRLLPFLGREGGSREFELEDKM
ncbi:unnamed protein product [Boreogadus saida]